MKRMVTGMALALALALPAVALAVDPAPGIYHSLDLGGAMLTGRGTQSWTAPLNAAQGLGDVMHSESWDGALLGTQWRFACGVQLQPQVMQDFRVGGTGPVVFTNTFDGGTFFLSKTGPWGDAVNDLTGTLLVTRAIATVTYVQGVPQSSRLNVDAAGRFDGSDCTLTFVIANGIGGGDTDLLPVPPGYPAFLDAGCLPLGLHGSWGDISQITMRVDCPVPAPRPTWGAIKLLYR